MCVVDSMALLNGYRARETIRQFESNQCIAFKLDNDCCVATAQLVIITAARTCLKQRLLY